MGGTHFSGPVYSGGMPLFNGMPVPFTGRYIFVNPASGSDGNTGDADSPLATLTAAYALTVSGRNDVVFLVGDGSTTGTARLSAGLDWAKNATHLIGITAPTMIAQRARISHLTTATTNINPLLTVSGSGCYFANFSLFQGIGQSGTDEKLADVTGDRNYFSNVHFGGMGHATGAARAGSYVLALTGAEENTFDGCTIGLDTIARSAANASVKLRSQSKRNIFRDCVFPLYATATSPLVVDANATSSVDRFNLFQRCAIINSGTSALAAVASFAADQGGFTFFDNSSALGASDWTASDTATVKITGPVPNGDTSGMAVNADAT